MTASLAADLREVDAPEVQAPVDNVTDSLSAAPGDVTHEWGHLRPCGVSLPMARFASPAPRGRR